MEQDTFTSPKWKQRIQSHTRRIHRNIEAARLRRVRRHQKPQYTYCKNCGMKLKGMYCHRCGQYALDIYQPFWKYIQQYFENVYQFDTKIWQTLRMMCTRPGFLTREFNAGKINSYVHPFRLYMCISVVFFTVFFMIVEHHTNKIISATLTPKVTEQLVEQLNSGKFTADTAIYTYNGKEFIKALESKGVEQIENLTNVTNMYTPKGLSLIRMPHILLDSCFRQINLDSTELAEIRKTQQNMNNTFQLNELDMGGISIQAGPGMDIQQLIDAYRHFQTDSVSDTYPKVYQWTPRSDTDELLSINTTTSFTLGQLSKWTPLYMMFLLPLFALLLRRAYRKQHLPYMWHFAHAVHINTVFLLLLTIPLGITFSTMGENHIPSSISIYVFEAFLTLIFIYMYISMHTVYRDGWIRTFFKTLFVFGTFSFISLLVAAGLIVWLVTIIVDKL